MDVAEQRYAEANTLCAPFDAASQNAQDAVKRAESDRRAAERKLAESGIRGRRQLRADHAVASEGVTVAERRLARVKEKAHGTNSIRTEARQDLEAARRNLRSHDQIERWSYLPERLQAIEDRIDALDTWRGWAVGRKVDGRRLTAAVEALYTSDDGVSQSLLTPELRARRTLAPVEAAARQQEHRGMEIDL